MSRYSTTEALMVSRHAIFGVRIRIVLAMITLNQARARVLREHLAIIKRREARLGAGTRPRRMAEPQPVSLGIVA